MLLTSACKYGIQATIYLGMQKDDSFVSIKKIAEEFTIPFHFLTKVLQLLTQAGIVESTKGAKGGVRLGKDPDAITLFDIIAVIDGEGIFHDCMLGLPGCGLNTPCPAHEFWAPIRTKYEISARAISLRDLASDTINKNLRIGK